MFKQSIFRVNAFAKISLKEQLFWESHGEDDDYLNKVIEEFLEAVMEQAIGEKIVSNQEILKDLNQ